ncbi:MAG TPA: hypoxanthine phosphoribosyltransferase [Coriobacteriia bacterium]
MRIEPAPEGAPDLIEGVAFDAHRLAERISEMGAAIGADYAGREIILVTLLRGGLYFLSDLCRAIDGPVRLDFMAISAYGTPEQGGGVRITKDLDEDIEGKDVLIVEDIIDTGLTLNYLLGVLRSRGPRSLQVAVLLDRDQRRIADVPISYRGFHMSDTFMVGYGLDLKGRYRNLPYLGVVRGDVIEAEAG